MAGFYIHIPFCRKVCYYCNFHFVASLKHKDAMLVALEKEIQVRSAQWNNTVFDTLYIGGGTPSVLSIDEINKLVSKVRKHYKFSENIEFTLEANPDDLTESYLKQLKKETDINRLSIGTQSFFDEHLELMNRRHTGKEAYDSIYLAQQEGFSNLNVDLIYGVPGMSNEQWRENIAKFLELKVPHLSAYHLSFEPKTVFDSMRKKNQIQPAEESLSIEQYDILIDTLKSENYKHYEVSNFAREGFYSKHNTSYWLAKKYIGIGPSAHSFMGGERSWNIANNTKYCKALSDGTDEYSTTEQLSISISFNEYLLTSLRTHWGVDIEFIQKSFGDSYLKHFVETLKKFELAKHYVETERGYALTEKGWFISDYIISELFIEE